MTRSARDRPSRISPRSSPKYNQNQKDSGDADTVVKRNAIHSKTEMLPKPKHRKLAHSDLFPLETTHSVPYPLQNIFRTVLEVPWQISQLTVSYSSCAAMLLDPEASAWDEA